MLDLKTNNKTTDQKIKIKFFQAKQAIPFVSSLLLNTLYLYLQ